MNDIPYAVEKESTYENFIAVCPHCQFKNIFNRVTDLKDVEPISYKRVECLFENCKKVFDINGDLASPAYKMLIFDCYSLLKDKMYSYCILNLAQSFEVFFSLYLRIKFLYKPFGSQREGVKEFNRLSSLLFETIKDYSYAKSRNIFINTVLSNDSIRNLGESEKYIKNLTDLVRVPSDSSINTEKDLKLRSLLMELKLSKIPTLRNKVVHKQAYRPMLSEVETAIEETRGIVLGLASCLNTGTNWYSNNA